MVLGLSIKPKEALKDPYATFLLGLVAPSLAIPLGLWIFPGKPSIAIIFLTVIGAFPLIIKIFEKKELKEEKLILLKILGEKEYPLIKEHIDIFEAVIALFFGFLIVFTTAFSILPLGLSKKIFSAQISTIKKINPKAIKTAALQKSAFLRVLSNNLRVLSFSLIFSFLYGSGALFILTWNASIIGVAIGDVIRKGVNQASNPLTGYFAYLPLGLSRYMIHGIFEIAAYLFGGIAGSIISVAMIRHDMGSEGYYEVLKDSLDLIILSFLLLIIGALLETGIIPLLF